MSPTTIIFLTSAGIIAYGCFHLFMSRSAIVKGAIEKVERKKIGEVKDGEIVNIKGKVVLVGRTLKAPLSQRKCAYYSIEVSNWRAGPDYNNIKEEKGGDLVIFDGEDYAMVNVKKVNALLHDDKIYHYDAFTTNLIEIITNSYEVREYLEKNGKPKTIISDILTEVCATEGVLEEGETIVVAGKASWKSSSKLKLNIPEKRILFIEPLNEHGVYLTEDLF